MSDTTADAAKRKAKRTAARRKAKRAEVTLDRYEWRERSLEVYQRDGGNCRACGSRTISVANGGGAHHIVYRSAGGTDDASNLVLLCWACHDDEHTHRLRIAGTADDLRIERRR